MYSYDLENMSVLNLPNSLEKIEDEVFEGLFCEAVIVPNCCTSIGNYAFRNCRKLKYVRIPANIEIAPNAFDSCGNVWIERVESE